MTSFNRRAVVKGAVALALTARSRLSFASAGESEAHGLSSFGDLMLGPDFRHFDYVNPQAPKGGTLVLQITQAAGNQNFDTFNTLNIFVLKGDGAAGMNLVFDSLMARCLDEPDALYGLVASKVFISADKLTYRFLLRPEARFHDGSPVTAKDAAFSFRMLKEKGHPTFSALLMQMSSIETEGENIVKIGFASGRSRDLPLTVASLPIFSAAFWEGRDFQAALLDPPLGSGAYKVGRFDQGRLIEFERVPDYWARDLPVTVGLNNFDKIRYEYYRDRTVAFEAFKNGALNYHAEYTARIWATGYDFPAFRDGRVKRREIPSGAPAPIQGWYFNLRRDAFKDSRIRQALGLAFDFEWTNANIMYGSYRRTTSYFENTDLKAVDLPSAEEMALLEPLRDRLPKTVFETAVLPPVSDGSGQDRALLRRADELLREAGCRRENGALLLPSGQPFKIEFLDFQAALQPHTQPFQANLKRLGIDARSRIVDPAQYQRRMEEYDFDMTSRALSGDVNPGDALRTVYGSAAAKTPGAQNIAGIADPAVDALVERISVTQTRDELIIACRALDRVLRSGYYWIPMWFRQEDWIAAWDEFSWPARPPRFSSGAPATWWHDAAKARNIGKTG